MVRMVLMHLLKESVTMTSMTNPQFLRIFQNCRMTQGTEQYLTQRKPLGVTKVIFLATIMTSLKLQISKLLMVNLLLVLVTL